MKACIVVATHKKYRMPTDNIYYPVHVGAKGKESIGYQRDDIGDNISEKNSCYCELTGLYWAWKNIDYDCLGLAHYRRHFSLKKKGNNPFDSILNSDELESLLRDNDILLPKKRMYYIETLESHFNHIRVTIDEDLDVLRKAISEIDASYVSAFERCITRRGGHMFNMFIMKKEYADTYCKWLFDVLSVVEKKVNLSTEIHPSRKRIIGYLAEFMLDIWIDKNKIPYKEINTIFMEKENEVRKIYKFFIRKYRRNK